MPRRRRARPRSFRRQRSAVEHGRPVEAGGLLRQERNGERGDHRARVVAHRQSICWCSLRRPARRASRSRAPAPRRAAPRSRHACPASPAARIRSTMASRSARLGWRRAAPRRSSFRGSGNASRAPRNSASASGESICSTTSTFWPSSTTSGSSGRCWRRGRASPASAHSTSRLTGGCMCASSNSFSDSRKRSDLRADDIAALLQQIAGCGRSRGSSGRGRRRSRSASAPRPGRP